MSFSALDLSTTEGREAFLDWQRDLFRRAEGLTETERGAFGSTEELGSSIESAADSVNAFDDAVSEATKSLTNVPATYKLGSAEWAARDVDVLAASGARQIPFDPVSLRVPAPRGGDGAALPLPAGSGGTGSVVITGPLSLTVQVPGANKSAGDIARAVMAELEHAATSTFGLAPPP